jgi:hypothetical protein
VRTDGFQLHVATRLIVAILIQPGILLLFAKNVTRLAVLLVTDIDVALLKIGVLAIVIVAKLRNS